MGNLGLMEKSRGPHKKIKGGASEREVVTNGKIRGASYESKINYEGPHND